MQKLLISWVCGASLLATGCSTIKNVGDVIPNALDKMPLIYRQNIQQGNVLNQEQIDKLQPGMSKTQVRYIMGTPMLIDVFHQNRWDYIYTMKEGADPQTQKRVALFFEDDQLARIEGDLRPIPAAEQEPVEKETVVDVPDYSGKNKGIFTRALETVGIESDD